MPTHTVKQGDHISSIAKQFGFRDFMTVWNDAGNADLRKLRPNPNVLFPGDQVFIPDFKLRSEARPTGATHTFVLDARPLEVRIVTHDINDDPVPNSAYKLEVEAAVFKDKTDGDGLAKKTIAADAVNGLFQIIQMEIPVKIGFLDPADQPSGSRARLTNLGYYWGPQDDSDPLALQSAIEEFQCDQTLKVTGKMDQATQDRLKSVHGC